MKKEIARKVADHLRKFPGHEIIKQQEDDGDLQLFDIPFPLTDAEGEVLARVMPFWETADEIARRMERDKEVIATLLDSLVKKLWVLVEGTGKRRKYQAHTSSVEFYMPWMNAENLSDLMGFWIPDPGDGADECAQRPIGPGDDEFLPYFRIVPRDGALPHDCEIQPAESVAHMIEHAGDNMVAVAECLCRKAKNLLGGSCDHNGPIEQCLFFQPFAQAAIEAGVARPITKAQAHEIIDSARKHGLIQEAYPSEHPKVLCSCCPDCCSPLQSLLQGVSSHTTPAKSNFYAQVNTARCLGTQDCIKKCPAEAITFDEKNSKAIVTPGKCIGCGVCVETCLHGGISLKRKEKIVRYAHTNDDYLEINARQTGRTEFYQNRAKNI